MTSTGVERGRALGERVLERGGEHAPVGEAVGGILREAEREHPLEGPRQIGDRRGRVIANPVGDLLRVGGGEGRRAGREPMEHRAGGEDVGTRAHRLAEDLFGRHEVGAGEGVADFERLGRARRRGHVRRRELDDPDAAVMAELDDGGAEVFEDDAAAVGVGEATRELERHRRGGVEAEPPAKDELGEHHPALVLEDEIRRLVGAHEVEEPDDRRMIELGEGGGLALDFLGEGRARAHRRLERADEDGAPERRLLGAVCRGEGPARELLERRVRPEPPRRHRCPQDPPAGRGSAELVSRSDTPVIASG